MTFLINSIFSPHDYYNLIENKKIAKYDLTKLTLFIWEKTIKDIIVNWVKGDEEFLKLYEWDDDLEIISRLKGYLVD